MTNIPDILQATIWLRQMILIKATQIIIDLYKF